MGKHTRHKKLKPKGTFTDSIGRTLVRCSTCNGFAPHDGRPQCGVCERKSSTRGRRELIKAIMNSNDSLTYDQSLQLAEMIESHGKPEKKGEPRYTPPAAGSNLQQRAEACGEYKLTFGQWSGCRLKDVSPDYIVWLSDLEESRKHSIDFLNAIRAARTIKLSWQEPVTTKDIPFDAD